MAEGSPSIQLEKHAECATSPNELAEALFKEARRRRRRRRTLFAIAGALVGISVTALGAGIGGGGPGSGHATPGHGGSRSRGGGASSPAIADQTLSVSCSQNIFSGPSLAALPSVDRSPDDVVIGPLRLARLASSIASVPTLGGSTYFGAKSPLTIADTPFSSFTLTVTGHPYPVTVAYGGYVSDPQPYDSLSIQSGLACGIPSAGFVQYAGGFAFQRPTCATITLAGPKGVIGSKRVPLGPKAHCP